jgi:putative transposase
MEILKNSIWEISELEGIDTGLFRVIHLFDEINCLIIFPLKDGSSLNRPLAAPLDRFNIGIRNKTILPGEFSPPTYLFVSEEEITPKHRKKRDDNFKLIENLSNDLTFLFDYSTKRRVPTLAQYAKDKDTYHKNIARLLNLYWRYGQDKNGLLPAYQNSGGYRQRAPGQK